MLKYLGKEEAPFFNICNIFLKSNLFTCIVIIGVKGKDALYANTTTSSSRIDY